MHSLENALTTPSTSSPRPTDKDENFLVQQRPKEPFECRMEQPAQRASSTPNIHYPTSYFQQPSPNMRPPMMHMLGSPVAFTQEQQAQYLYALYQQSGQHRSEDQERPPGVPMWCVPQPYMRCYPQSAGYFPGTMSSASMDSVFYYARSNSITTPPHSGAMSYVSSPASLSLKELPSNSFSFQPGQPSSPSSISLKICSNCGCTSTPSWRRCPIGKQLLCNACGLYQKLHSKPRPFCVLDDGSVKVQRNAFLEQNKCGHCHTTETPLWRRGANGQSLCNACGLYFKQHRQYRPSMSGHPSTPGFRPEGFGYNGVLFGGSPSSSPGDEAPGKRSRVDGSTYPQPNSYSLEEEEAVSAFAEQMLHAQALFTDGPGESGVPISE